MAKLYSLIWTIGIGIAVSVILLLCANLLPDSPFQQFIAAANNGVFSQYLKFVFYFIPVGKMIAVIESWVLVMTSWYTFRIIYKIFDHVVSTMGNPFSALLKK